MSQNKPRRTHSYSFESSGNYFGLNDDLKVKRKHHHKYGNYDKKTVDAFEVKMRYFDVYK